jgi:hypothetical protein
MLYKTAEHNICCSSSQICRSSHISKIRSRVDIKKLVRFIKCTVLNNSPEILICKFVKD